MTKKIQTHLNYIIHLIGCPDDHRIMFRVRDHLPGGSETWQRQCWLECAHCHRQAYLPEDGTDWAWEWDHEECDCEDRPLNPRIFDAWRHQVETLKSKLSDALKVQSADAAKWYKLYEVRGTVIDRVTEERDKLADEVKTRDAEIDRLAKVSNAATARSIKLSEQNEQLKVQVEVALACAKAIERERDLLKAEVSGRTQGNAILSQANEALVKQREELKAKLAQEIQHHEYYRERVSLYIGSEAALQKENLRLQREWDVAHGANEALVNERLELKAKLREEQEQNKVLLAANSQLAEANALLKKWREQLLAENAKRMQLISLNPELDHEI